MFPKYWTMQSYKVMIRDSCFVLTLGLGAMRGFGIGRFGSGGMSFISCNTTVEKYQSYKGNNYIKKLSLILVT